MIKFNLCRIPVSHFLCVVVVLFQLFGCSERKKHEMVVNEWMGKELEMPESVCFMIGDGDIESSLDYADFTIVTYVDSAGCSNCKMKLKEWSEFLNELNLFSDDVVDFRMIVNSKNKGKVKNIVRLTQFLYPVAIDDGDLFNKENNLPKKSEYQTFLLDSDNRVLVVGNPIYNPKIRKIYKDIINRGEEDTFCINFSDSVSLTCINASRPLGLRMSGDVIRETYRIVNKDTMSLSIQQVVPSCSCVETIVNKNVLKSKDTLDVEVKFTPESDEHRFNHKIDIYFNELQKPYRLSVHGYQSR